MSVARYTGDGAEPSRAYHGDAGFDLEYNGIAPLLIESGECVDIPCGVSVEWPDEHMWGMMVGRSSTFRNLGLMVNVAVIDAGYRGELFAVARNITHHPVWVHPGDRIAQIIPMPLLAEGMKMQHAESLSSTMRGANGFGSSGR